MQNKPNNLSLLYKIITCYNLGIGGVIHERIHPDISGHRKQYSRFYTIICKRHSKFKCNGQRSTFLDNGDYRNYYIFICVIFI